MLDEARLHATADRDDSIGVTQSGGGNPAQRARDHAVLRQNIHFFRELGINILGPVNMPRTFECLEDRSQHQQQRRVRHRDNDVGARQPQ